MHEREARGWGKSGNDADERDDTKQLQGKVKQEERRMSSETKHVFRCLDEGAQVADECLQWRCRHYDRAEVLVTLAAYTLTKLSYCLVS